MVLGIIKRLFQTNSEEYLYYLTYLTRLNEFKEKGIPLSGIDNDAITLYDSRSYQDHINGHNAVVQVKKALLEEFYLKHNKEDNDKYRYFKPIEPAGLIFKRLKSTNKICLENIE